MNIEKNKVQERIKKLIDEGVLELTPELRVWAEGHLIQPRQVQLISNTQSLETSKFWLVTDHTGVDDSSYRIIYDENFNQFGFEVTLNDDRELFVGRVGSFANTINNL